MNIKHHCFNKALREKTPSCSTCNSLKKRLQENISPPIHIYIPNVVSFEFIFVSAQWFSPNCKCWVQKNKLSWSDTRKSNFLTYCACHALNFIDSAGLTHLRITHLKKLNESNEVYKNTWNLSDSYLKVHKLHNILSGINILTTNCRLVQQ